LEVSGLVPALDPSNRNPAAERRARRRRNRRRRWCATQCWQ